MSSACSARAWCPDDILSGKTTTLLGGKRLLSFSTSGTTSQWLEEQGQQVALRTIFDRYLMFAFGMHSQEHVHFGHVTDEMSAETSSRHLQDVKEHARHICAEVAVGDEAVLHDHSLAGAAST